LYAETVGKPLYAPTRVFYAGAGFTLQDTLPDFCASGDQTGLDTIARFVEAQSLTPAVIELGRARAGMVRHLRGIAACGGRPRISADLPAQGACHNRL
jgi:hypothetical protein